MACLRTSVTSCEKFGLHVMSEPAKAVFLSYASQDAEAAKRICDALRCAGVEVGLDRNECRGGAESGLACKIEMDF